LFDDSRTIGFLLNWERAIEQKGYRLVGEVFQPIGNDVVLDAPDFEPDSLSNVQRHLTALARTAISAPVQLLLRHGLLAKDVSFIDFGCGRGDDVEALASGGFNVIGWDPYFAPSNTLAHTYDVVNLGFVINVIEDPAERIEALHKAFGIASGVMSVAVMLCGPERLGKPFRDGVMTSRGTFQKYFTQQELKEYIELVLHQEAFMVGPGIAFVFSDKEIEQRFLSTRYRTRSVGARLIRESRRLERKRVNSRIEKTHLNESRLAASRPILETIWQITLELGRYPEFEELPPGTQLIGPVPTLRRAIRLIESAYDLTLLERSRNARIDDLRLYLAMQQFAKRCSYRQLERRLQRDVRAFFGDYPAAHAAGVQLLRDAANTECILEACRHAAEEGFGWLDEERSLQVHVNLVDRLPAVLRAYVACAMILMGGLSEAVLVKIHIKSGKVSLMEFENFASNPLPLMTRRVKVNLKSQTSDQFEYGGQYPKPVLFRKSRYLHEDSAGYAEQLAFDEKLEATGVLATSEFGPSADELTRLLEQVRLSVQGLDLVSSNTIPDIDARCGAHFTYRDFIECGETQHRLGLSNTPKRAATYNALYGLATCILDPLIEYFGSIRLTYGFCSNELAREIKSRIAPRLDQHAAEELKASGIPICSRGGAACDFIVDDEDMREVSNWVVDNLPIDRLYFYGSNRPLHVSWSPEGVSEAYEMIKTSKGHLIPKRIHLHRVGKTT
jgi:DNA phosphorothioation-associated putative methyltransferase